MKGTALIKGKRVRVEIESLIITILGISDTLEVGTPVEIQSPNSSQSHLNSWLVIEEVLGGGKYKLKFNSKIQ
ncbi:MAG: hypothetical protein ABIJ82_02370 [Patescibacteria group bacterium]